MARVYQGERVLARAACSGRSSGSPTGCSGSTRAPSRTGRPTRARRSSSARSSGVALYVILRTQGIHPFNPEGFHSGPWDVTFNTTVLVRHEHELAVLRRRDDAHLLLADGRAGGAELRLGRAWASRSLAAVIRGFAARSRRRRSGNFWQDLTRTLLYVLLPICARRRARARLAGRDPDPLALRDRSRRSRAATRRSRSARWPRRRPSSSWAPTAAASSTSTARCRSRTPTGSRTSSRCC